MNRPLACIVLLLAVCGAYALDGYSFQQGVDSIGNDLHVYPDASVEDLKAFCDIDVTCLGFNTLGFLKSVIVPSIEYLPMSTGSELSEGLYVKIPVIPGYVFTQGVDIYGGDIGQPILGVPATTLKVACDSDATCLGFSSYGFLKNIIPSADQWQYSSNDPLQGVYIKVDNDVNGYTFASGRDTSGSDIKLMPGASITDLEIACNADATCVGFNTAGFLKSMVQPIENWVSFPSYNGAQGLFVKIPSIKGYNFIQGMDIWGGDLKHMAGASVADMKAACDADSTCFAFTSFGYLKNLVPSESEWHHMTLDPQAGVYLKNGEVQTEKSQNKTKQQGEEEVKLPTGTCWLESYGRGAGAPISNCPDGFEKNGALCYPSCSDGFYGVGPVCWSHCPGNFRDDGAFCAKPAPYGRGAGYALWSQSKCNRENSQGCEKWGAMYYPRCGPNFHNAGCCICSPDCPGGMTDIGVSCTKHSYGRGAGTVLTCAPGQDPSGGLCYPYCREGYKGIGPVCWSSCPPNFDSCGALCVPSGQCVGKILKISASAIKGGAKVAGSVADATAGDPSSIMTGIDGVHEMLEGFNYPICGQTDGVLDPAVQVTGIIQEVSKLIKGGDGDSTGEEVADAIDA